MREKTDRPSQIRGNFLSKIEKLENLLVYMQVLYFLWKGKLGVGTYILPVYFFPHQK
jgi:hypothetical protein